MADAIVQIDQVWNANYQPWLVTNFPWCTTGTLAERIEISLLTWERADLTWAEINNTWGDSMYPQPTVIEGTGITVTPGAETFTLTVQNPTIVEGAGINVPVGTETLTLAEQAPTIIEGTGISVSVGTESITITAPAPQINFGFTVFPETETVTLSVLTPSKAGPLWDIRGIPTTNWAEIADVVSNWETRNQVLWSPLILPWASTFLPWLVEDRREIPTYTERTSPTYQLTWGESTETWAESLQNWEGYETNQTITTNWN